MKKIALVVRVLLGLVYVVFGLNGFFQFSSSLCRRSRSRPAPS